MLSGFYHTVAAQTRSPIATFALTRCTQAVQPIRWLPTRRWASYRSTPRGTSRCSTICSPLLPPSSRDDTRSTQIVGTRNPGEGMVEADGGIECAIGDRADHDGARNHAEGDWPSVVVIDGGAAPTTTDG